MKSAVKKALSAKASEKGKLGLRDLVHSLYLFFGSTLALSLIDILTKMQATNTFVFDLKTLTNSLIGAGVATAIYALKNLTQNSQGQLLGK